MLIQGSVLSALQDATAFESAPPENKQIMGGGLVKFSFRDITNQKDLGD